MEKTWRGKENKVGKDKEGEAGGDGEVEKSYVFAHAPCPATYCKTHCSNNVAAERIVICLRMRKSFEKDSCAPIYSL
jgi:hypothetical protein